jgi:hypothetical protein
MSGSNACPQCATHEVAQLVEHKATLPLNQEELGFPSNSSVSSKWFMHKPDLGQRAGNIMTTMEIKKVIKYTTRKPICGNVGATAAGIVRMWAALAVLPGATSMPTWKKDIPSTTLLV